MTQSENSEWDSELFVSYVRDLILPGELGTLQFMINGYRSQFERACQAQPSKESQLRVKAKDVKGRILEYLMRVRRLDDSQRYDFSLLLDALVPT